MKRKTYPTYEAFDDVTSMINGFTFIFCLFGGLSWWWFAGTMITGTALNSWAKYKDEKDSKKK